MVSWGGWQGLNLNMMTEWGFGLGTPVSGYLQRQRASFELKFPIRQLRIFPLTMSL
jgi:hypothetical protein